jgi:segregation and condensation protein B
MTLDAKIESILFWKSSPLRIKELSSILNVSEGDINQSLEILKEKLSDRGLKIVQDKDSIAIVTDPENSGLIEKLNREELIKDLSKAALETLSVILYQGPVKRSEIDYIRGVNSQFILRTLSVRGLINKKVDPSDERAYTYEPSINLLKYLGITKREDLPEYETVQKDLYDFVNADTQNEDEEN